MGRIRRVEAQLCNVDTVAQLPKNKVYSIWDCDGTLTKGQELLLVTFVRDKAVHIGDPAAKGEILRLAKEHKEGKSQYEPYLQDVGEAYAEMVAGEKETRVQEICDNWYDRKGCHELEDYAPDVIMEMERHYLEQLMLTGSPGQLARPIASHLGIKYVCAMMAETDENGVFTGVMRRQKNTGKLSFKGRVCRRFSKEHKTAIGGGDTLSDNAIMHTATGHHRDNKTDYYGHYFLMNNDPVKLETILRSNKPFLDDDLMTVIDKDAEKHTIMRYIRSGVRKVCRDNYKFELLRDIEGVRPFTPEEMAEAQARLKAAENPWD